MRYAYWAVLAINIVVLAASIIRGSSTWWVSLIGIAFIAGALALDAHTRKATAAHKERMRLSNEEFMQRMEAIRNAGRRDW